MAAFNHVPSAMPSPDIFAPIPFDSAVAQTTMREPSVSVKFAENAPQLPRELLVIFAPLLSVIRVGGSPLVIAKLGVPAYAFP